MCIPINQVTYYKLFFKAGKTLRSWIHTQHSITILEYEITENQFCFTMTAPYKLNVQKILLYACLINFQLRAYFLSPQIFSFIIKYQNFIFTSGAKCMRWIYSLSQVLSPDDDDDLTYLTFSFWRHKSLLTSLMCSTLHLWVDDVIIVNTDFLNINVPKTSFIFCFLLVVLNYENHHNILDWPRCHFVSNRRFALLFRVLWIRSVHFVHQHFCI